jgi:hypothetical protein
MGWDGMGWDGMGWDGMGWDGMGWDGMGWLRTHACIIIRCEGRHRAQVMRDGVRCPVATSRLHDDSARPDGQGTRRRVSMGCQQTVTDWLEASDWLGKTRMAVYEVARMHTIAMARHIRIGIVT